MQPSAALLKPCRYATPLQAQKLLLLQFSTILNAAFGCAAQTLSLRDPDTGPKTLPIPYERGSEF